MDVSLLEHDAGYYEYCPGKWLPGKPGPKGWRHWGPGVVAKAAGVEWDDSDVLIATYPKTGQTWTMTIIRNILQAKDLESGMRETQINDFYTKIPFLEMILTPDGTTGADVFKTQAPPRYMKTHLAREMWDKSFEKHPNVKVIQTLRNPKDALVSYYYHFIGDLSMGGFNGTWDQFFEIIKAKKLPWGDFFEVNAEWYKFNKDREHSLVLVYEEMQKDPRGHVAKIAKFLGVDLSEKALDVVTHQSSLKEAAPKINSASDSSDEWRSDKVKFVRKGGVGGWRNYFSPEQSAYVEARYKECLEPLGLTFTYSQ